MRFLVCTVRKLTVSRKWRNWQTRTLEGRVGQPMQVQVLSCAFELKEVVI